MKLDNPSETKVEGSEDFTSHDFRITDANTAHIFRMLTEYSDPIGSVVREITTNCFDAHRKAGVDRDVVIDMRRGSKLDGIDREIRFVDYGTGLTPKQVREIFTVLGESTKRDTNEEMGAFGIGAKSPFGYIRENDLGGFIVDSYVDGTHWQYFLAESAEEGPQMTEILEEDTDRTNGVVVTVPIASGHFYKFKRALTKQLAYFENIDFQVDDVDNDYTIYRGNHFIYRPDSSPYDNIHACFGKVAYPLDYDILDWPTGYGSREKMDAPIGLLFDIGDLKVVPNREQINYTEQVIDTIHEKMKLAQEEFQEMWDNAHDGIDSIKGLVEARKNKSNKNITVKGVDIPYSDKLLPDNSITLNFFDELSPPKDIFYRFNIHKSVDNQGYINSNARTPNVNTSVLKGKDCYFVEHSYSPKTNRYIASRYGDDLQRDWYLIKKNSKHSSIKSRFIIDDPAEDDWEPSDDPLSSDKPPLDKCEHPERHRTRFRYDKWWTGYNGPNEKDYDELTNSQLAKILKFEKMVRDYVTKHTNDYSSYEPSEDFEEWEKKKREQKEKQKKKKRENQFPIKILEEDSSWDGDYKWKMDDMKYDALNNSTMYIYGFQKHSDELLDLGPLVFSNDNWQRDKSYSNQPSRKKIAVLKIAMKREYLFEDLDNAMHISNFQDGHYVIDRAYHANWVLSKIDPNRSDAESHILSKFFPDVAAKINEITNRLSPYSDRSLPDSPSSMGVELSDGAKKNYIYDEDEILWLEHSYDAIREQLPLIENMEIGGYGSPDMDWEEFSIYMKAKDLVHPKLWAKYKGII